MDTSLEWMIVFGRRFISEHRTVEEKRKTSEIIQETSDGLDEKQKNGRSYGRR